MEDQDGAVNQESLDRACAGLQSSVRGYISKYAKKNKRLQESELKSLEQDAHEAVRHACHLLRQLSIKKSSLWHGIRQLASCWKQEYLVSLETSSNSSDYSKWLFPILSRFFQHYLRLRDGTVLLISGECRHVGDTSDPKFPSRLSTLQNQSDGYTKIYSAPRGYSGFGWDEFFQETVGIQKRLVNALQRISRKSRVWEYLLEHGAQAFESCLDMYEASVSRVRGELATLRQTFCSDLKQFLKSVGGGKVEMVKLDKMERLNVVVNGNGDQKTHFELERLADKFQVTDKGGALPNGWTQREWNRVMRLPATEHINVSTNAGKQPTRKKRRIIDSDSEDENVENVAPSKDEGGLKVRKQTEKTSSSPEASLNAIKVRLGVDAAELEAAREVAEAEEQKVKQKPATQEEEANQEANDLEADIAEMRDKIKSLRRVLKRAIEENDDEYEVWDARECLRESIMTLGSLLLSLHAGLDDKDYHKSSGLLLEQAEELFREAVCLVEQQKAAHEVFSKQTNDLTKESFRIEQSLWLLHGRAYTNLGISLVEQSLLNTRGITSRALLSKGITELKNARECAKKMRKNKSDRGAGMFNNSLDAIHADQLECLSSRWLARALWHQGLREDSKDEFERAVSLFNGDNEVSSSVRDSDVIGAELLLGIECFYASATLAEVASEALENLPAKSCVEKNGSDLFTVACRGYALTKNTCTAIEKLTLNSNSPYSFEELQKQHTLMAAEEISNIEKELKQWWEHKKARAAAGTFIPLHDQDPALPRNDLNFDGPLHSSTAPSRRFVVTGGSSTPSTKSARGTVIGGTSGGWRRGRDGSHRAKSSINLNKSGEAAFGGTSFYQFLSDGSAEETIQFRKWGDELLPEVPGESGSKLCYPACAPERPSEGIGSH